MARPTSSSFSRASVAISIRSARTWCAGGLAVDPPAQQIDDRRPALARGRAARAPRRAPRRRRDRSASRACQAPSARSTSPSSRASSAASAQVKRFAPGLGSTGREPLEGVEPFRLVSEPVVESPPDGEGSRAAPRGARPRCRSASSNSSLARSVPSELAILDPRRADQQLGAAFRRPAGRSAGRQRRGQPRRIARRLGELPQAVLDRPVLGRERDERDVLFQRTRDVAQGVQAVAALATQVAEALPRREADRGHQRGAARARPRRSPRSGSAARRAHRGACRALRARRRAGARAAPPAARPRADREEGRAPPRARRRVGRASLAAWSRCEAAARAPPRRRSSSSRYRRAATSSAQRSWRSSRRSSDEATWASVGRRRSSCSR